MKKLLILLLAVYIIAACKSRNGSGGVENNTDSTAGVDSAANDSAKMFLITPFILSQVQFVDSTPIGIMLRTETDGKKDSGFISKEYFRELADNFIKPDLNDSSLSKEYNENNYFDAAINKVVQDISTKNKEAIINNAHIYFNKDTRKITGVYLEKSFTKGDTAIKQKLQWKADRNFRIITFKYIDGKELITNQMAVWDSRD
jgi:hypothetical protein